MGRSKPGIRRWRNLGTIVMSGRPGMVTEGKSSSNPDGSEKVPIWGSLRVVVVGCSFVHRCGMCVHTCVHTSA